MHVVSLVAGDSAVVARVSLAFHCRPLLGSQIRAEGDAGDQRSLTGDCGQT